MLSMKMGANPASRGAVTYVRSLFAVQMKLGALNVHFHMSVCVYVCVCVCLCMYVRPQAKALASSNMASLRQECESLREQLEEEQESKMELQRLVSKLNSDVTHWRSRLEADSIQHGDELEDAKYDTRTHTHACTHAHTNAHTHACALSP